MKRAAKIRTERAADAHRDGRIAEDRAEAFAGKNIRRQRRENHRARAKADAEKDYGTKVGKEVQKLGNKPYYPPRKLQKKP